MWHERGKKVKMDQERYEPDEKTMHIPFFYFQVEFDVESSD